MRFFIIVYNIVLLIVQVRISAVWADFLLFGFRRDFKKKNVYFVKSQGSRFNLLTNMFKFRKKSIFFSVFKILAFHLGTWIFIMVYFYSLQSHFLFCSHFSIFSWPWLLGLRLHIQSISKSWPASSFPCAQNLTSSVISFIVTLV